MGGGGSERRRKGEDIHSVLQHPVVDDRRIKQPFFFLKFTLCSYRRYLGILFHCFLVILHLSKLSQFFNISQYMYNNEMKMEGKVECTQLNESGFPS